MGWLARKWETLTSFLQQVRQEMTKVTWPTVEDLRSSTAVVMMLLAILGVIVGAFDVIFQWAVMGLLRLA